MNFDKADWFFIGSLVGVIVGVIVHAYITGTLFVR
jgi:hypothetical protein